MADSQSRNPAWLSRAAVLARTVGAVTKVFLLALAASIDAVLLAAVVLLLGRPRPQRQLLSFWLGAFGLSTAIGLVIVLALGRSGLHVNQNGSASPGIEIAVGVILLAVAVAIGSGLTDRLKAKRTDRHQHQNTKHRPTLADRLRGDDSLWPALAAGVAYSVPGAYIRTRPPLGRGTRARSRRRRSRGSVSSRSRSC